MIEKCSQCGFTLNDTWIETNNKEYSYRILNDVNVFGSPIYKIQRREVSRHHVGNWKDYSLRVFHEGEKEEAEKLLIHLKGNK